MSDVYYWILTLALFLTITLLIGGSTLGALQYMYEQEITSDQYKIIQAKKKLGKPLSLDEVAYDMFIHDKAITIKTLVEYSDILLVVLVVLAVMLVIIRFSV
jgi:hypothetical protein